MAEPTPSQPLPSSSAGTVTATIEPTTYIVLARDDTGRWTMHEKPVKAYSAEAAIKSLGVPSIFVAVPSRSWKPTKVSAVQTTVLKLEDATELEPS